MTRLDASLARAFAASTLGHLVREYPNSLQLVLDRPEDARPPSALHPIFYGSFDWHSCVHGWWQVMRIARLFPALPEAAAARALADRMLVADRVAGELAYLARPSSAGWERPYGWGWLLALHDELGRHAEPRWANALAPLAHAFAARFHAYLPKLHYPVRHGVHANTAFALIHAHGWAVGHDAALAALIAGRAAHWFGGDRAVRPLEPSGEDFLSGTLTAALLMQRVLPAPAFADWFAAYLPEVPAALLEPATVTDRSDGRLAHLDGLNLSRAWCWRALAAAAARDDLAQAAARHLDAALPHLADDYMGEHWLASFALLASE